MSDFGEVALFFAFLALCAIGLALIFRGLSK